MSEAHTPRPRVLVTGFGPFPGHAVNASASLAAHLADIAPQRWPHIDIRTATLPTEWRAGLDHLAKLWDSHEPHVALHFGISDRAGVFTIERHAYNECCADLDACGEQAASDRFDPSLLTGAAAASPWAEPLARQLLRHGLPVAVSDDPGRYLCNAVYYASLTRNGTLSPPATSLFVHIPATLAFEPDNTPTAKCHRDWSEAQQTAALIIDTLLKIAGPRIPGVARD